MGNRVPAISDSHVNSILRISALAAECSVEAQFPPALFRDMTELFGSKSCVFYSMCEDLDNHPIWDGLGYNLSAGKVRDYELHYRGFDPCFAGLKQRAAAGKGLVVSTDQVIASDHSYISSAYYHDFLLPQRIHNSIIFAVGDSQGLLGLFGFHRARGKPRYGPSEHLKARLLASQVAGALRLRKMSDSHTRLRVLVKKLMERASIRDYVVLDRHWHVIDSAGEAAANLLGPSTSVQIVDEFSHTVSLGLPKKIKSHFLDRLARLATSSASNEGKNDSHRIFENILGWPRVLADLLEPDAVQPLFLLAFLNDKHELVSESKLSEFSITPREREIARKVSRGLTTTQIAYQLKISEKTVEQHLDHMYRKTGTHNRTALIYRLSG